MSFIRFSCKVIVLLILLSLSLSACNNGSNEALPAPTNQPAIQPSPTPTTQYQPSPLVIFREPDKLQAMRLTVNDGTVIVGQAITLLENVAIGGELKIVQDGQAILYTHDLEDGYNALSLVSIEDGAQPQLLVSSDSLPPAQEDFDPAQSRRIISNYDELPNGQGFWFNTATNFLDNSDRNYVTYDDLGFVQPDGTQKELLPPGAGVGITISNQGQLLFVQADIDISDTEQSTTEQSTIQGHIIRMNLDGSDRAELGPFDFPFIARYQLIGFPNKQWTQDGSYAYVIIPTIADPEDPFADDAEGVLWQIPSQGEPQQLNVLPGNYFYHNQVVWSDNGTQMAIIDRNPAETQLFIADGDGQNSVPYDETDINRRFLSWHPDENRFLFGGDKYFALGTVGSEPQQYRLRSLHTPFEAVWITDDLFLVRSHLANGSEVALSSGTIDGEIELLFTADQGFVLWAGQDR